MSSLVQVSSCVRNQSVSVLLVSLCRGTNQRVCFCLLGILCVDLSTWGTACSGCLSPVVSETRVGMNQIAPNVLRNNL